MERGSLDIEAELADSLPVGLPSELLQRRPDVRSAEQQLRAAMAGVGVAYADRFPRLMFRLTGGWENNELRGFFSSPFSYVIGGWLRPSSASAASRPNTVLRWPPTTRRAMPMKRKCSKC